MGLCSAIMALEQWLVLKVPHLLWLGFCDLIQYSHNLITINGYLEPYLKQILTKVVVVVVTIIVVVGVVIAVVVVDDVVKTAEVMLRSICCF